MAFCIVDVSSLIHCAMHAAYSAARHANKPFTGESLHLTAMAKVARFCKAKGIDRARVLYALDCPRKYIWRHGLVDRFHKDNPSAKFAEYKGTRKLKDEKSAGKFDIDLYRSLITWFEERNPDTSYRGRDMEADDVVYMMCKAIPEEHPVYIMARDSDYCQIRRANTFIICPITLTIKDDWLMLTDVDKRLFLLNKCLLGDSADNVLKCCSVSMATNLMATVRENPDDEEHILASSDIDHARYHLNHSIVSFDAIPQHLLDIHLPAITAIFENAISWDGGDVLVL